MTEQYSSQRARALRSDLVTANKILVAHGILDAFGHVSVRNPDNPETFLLSRNLAPGLVTEDDLQTLSFDGSTEDPRSSYLERFLHAGIYRSHPDVQAIVHSHSASMVPFSVAQTPLRAIWHMASFLGQSVPVFEIRNSAGDGSDLLIRNIQLGDDLADCLGSEAVVLMRGHGFTAVGETLAQAVARSVYADLNARAQVTAIQLGGATPLTSEESTAASAANSGQFQRAWDVWKSEVQ